MSIYATLWRLKFPRYGDDHTGCEWAEVIAQGVPAHIGTLTPGYGYEAGDPYAAFLPPPIAILSDEDEGELRAVVFIKAGTPKGTERSHQEYVNPLLVLSGEEYESLPFPEVHRRICEALRGDRPQVIAEYWESDGTMRLMFEDGEATEVSFPQTDKGRGGPKS